MSSVAISGNASGAGVLTIAAPNTASNYTLTLPTQTGTLVSGTNANSVTLPGATSGTATITASAVAGSNTATLPASTGNVLLDVARSVTNNGYITLSNGVIIQWGRGTASSINSGTSTTVTFSTANIAFPTACFAVWVELTSVVSATGTPAGLSAAIVTALSATAFTWYRQNNGNTDPTKDYFWFAVGN